MAADTGSCCSRAAADARPHRANPRAPRRAPWLALTLGIAAALVPKCPLCVAAYLSVFGVALGAAGAVVPLLRPLGIALAALSLAVLVARWRRNARHAIDER